MRLAEQVLDRMRADEMGTPFTLTFSSDEDAGWHRRKSGRGFVYRDASGNKPDVLEMARIQALVIPPAWRDVWICKDASGHIQATGRDERGRKQYRYHDAWTAQRSATKFETLIEFGETLPALRAQVESDLRRRSLCYERVIASVVWLLDNSLIRIGNPAYARDNKSFGLTTLRRRHVDITGHTLRFQFKGKSGKEWRLELADRRIARIVRSLQEMPGQHLFKYQDESGLCAISSRDVNDYLANFAGPGFTAKHFRTWAGTVRAFGLLADTPLPETKTAMTRAVNSVLDQVAASLGNTRAVCRSSYVHPQLVPQWQAGALGRSGRLQPVDGLDLDEAQTLSFLKRLPT